MAKPTKNAIEEETTEQAAPAPEPKKSNSKLLIILIAAVVLLLIGVGVLAFMLMGSGDDHGAAPAPKQHVEESNTDVDNVLAEQEAEPEDPQAAPVYLELGKFHSNLKPEQGDSTSSHLVLIEASLKLKNAEVEQKVKDRLPEIRDRILRLLNTRTASQLDHPQEKSRLSDDIFIEANRVLNPELAGVVELRMRSRGLGGGERTGHDVQTDTSGVHENATPTASSQVSSSIQDDTGLTRKLPVQRVLFTSFIVQRM